jgi:Tfp pilus assembly protein PilF
LRRAAAVLVLCAAVAAYAGDDDPDRGSAFHAAEVRAAAGDVGAIDALEAIGAARPITRWTDDAWSEAAGAAERAGDLARARRDYEHALELAGDDTFARRVRGDLARLAQRTGETGAFAGVAAAHERLVAQIQAGGDPKPALRELGALVDANPGYPHAATAMLALAAGWERDGAFATARAWLVRAQATASPDEHERVFSEAARFAIRAHELGDAETAIAQLHDRQNARELAETLDAARVRYDLRRGLWGLLAAIAIAAIVVLRRDAGSWRAAARRLLRPPTEVVFLAPIAIVIGVFAATGNPLVARAVRGILGVGVAVAWVSGALLVRPVSGKRALVHGLVALVTVIAAGYLAIDHDRMIDLVVETLRSGPDAR